MATFFFVCFNLSFFDDSLAQESVIDQELTDLSNQVIRDIYGDIFEVKYLHKELSQFGPQVLVDNEYGISKISYQYTDLFSGNKKNLFELHLEVQKIKDKPYSLVKRRAFHYTFPILGIRVDGYQKKSLKKQFELKPIVDDQILPIINREQKELPLKLTIETSQSTFQTGEPIEFTVTLTNTTQRNLQIKKLSPKTVSFLLDDKPWKLISVANKRLKTSYLKPGEFLSAIFKGNSLKKPRELKIQATYLLSYKGVYPTAVKKVNTIE